LVKEISFEKTLEDIIYRKIGAKKMYRYKHLFQIRKITIILSLAVALALLAGVSVLAVVPTSTFGYITLCHQPNTPDQETLILRPDEAAPHFEHGDVRVRCADPVPASAFDPEVDLSKGYFVDEIQDGLFWATDGTYQIIFMEYKHGVIVVDAPPTMGGNILKAIADVTDKPITHVVYSHSHADHIAAAGIYPEDATIIAHEETATLLEKALSPDRDYPYGVFAGGGPVPLPDITFKKQFTFRRGDQVLKLEYKGPNHQAGNIFIYAPKQKTLMLVDVVFPAWSPFTQLALAEYIPGYYEAYDQVLSYDFETFVGGHLTRLGTREDVETAQEYVLDVRANAASALGEVDFFAIAAETGFTNQWLLINTYLEAVAQNCAEKTVPAWTGRLAGVDLNTFSHCFAAMESLRID
jgi:glyoxylase-like metal-dependent hydrolase (beta-lactamase superfamily II)